MLSLLEVGSIPVQGTRIPQATRCSQKKKKKLKCYVLRLISCLENPMDGGAWWPAVHGVARSKTRLSDFSFTFHFMHWRRKWQPTPVFLPGESQGQGSLVGCPLWGRTESDTTERLSLFTFMLWRRKWQPTPEFLPGESQGWGSLVGSVMQSRTRLK